MEAIELLKNCESSQGCTSRIVEHRSQGNDFTEVFQDAEGSLDEPRYLANKQVLNYLT